MLFLAFNWTLACDVYVHIRIGHPPRHEPSYQYDSMTKVARFTNCLVRVREGSGTTHPVVVWPQLSASMVTNKKLNGFGQYECTFVSHASSVSLN